MFRKVHLWLFDYNNKLQEDECQTINETENVKSLFVVVPNYNKLPTALSLLVVTIFEKQTMEQQMNNLFFSVIV